jgi:two-component system, NtrC family, sensor kinase
MDFVAVAHDLRTPLNVVLAYVRLLSAEHVSDLGRHRLDIIETQIGRMMRLLDTCVARTDAPRLTLIDLNTAIRNVAAELEAMLQQRQIDIELDVDESLPPMWGDADALHRVLLNVLVNSADAISGSGRIRVSARCARAWSTQEQAIQIEVTDTGTGIPADVLPCVFDRGFTTKRPGHGSGLGLGICRDIIHMHGGRMELLSEQGKGTTVRLSLPIGA